MIGYEVSVDDAVTQSLNGDEGTSVTVYVVRVSREARGLCVMLRYSQLRNLHKLLLDKQKSGSHRCAQLEACGFPSRRPFTMSAFTDKLITERKVQVQRYLANLFELVYVLEDRDVRKMFRLDEIPNAQFDPSPSAPVIPIPSHHLAHHQSQSQSQIQSQIQPLIQPQIQPQGAHQQPQIPNASPNPPPFPHLSSSAPSLSSPASPLPHAAPFSPFTVEKTRCGIRSWVWTQLSVFQYHALKLNPPLKLRFVSLKRQALSVCKARALTTVFLRAGCAMSPLAAVDRATRLRNSLRAGFPFVIEGSGPASLSLHLAARSPLDLSYWINAFKCFTAITRNDPAFHAGLPNGEKGPPSASPLEASSMTMSSTAPSLSSVVGSHSVFAGWLLFFTPEGSWRSVYCMLNAKTGVLSLCKKVELLRFSVEHATFSSQRRPDSRVPLLISLGPSQQLSLLFDHPPVETVWASTLRLVQQRPFLDFSMLSFDDIVEQAALASPHGAPKAALPLSDVERAIAMGRRRASSVSPGTLSSNHHNNSNNNNNTNNNREMDASNSDQSSFISRTASDDPSTFFSSSSNSSSSNASSSNSYRMSLNTSLLLRPVTDADHLEFRAQINAIMTANPRSLLRPFPRRRAASSPSDNPVLPLRVLALDGGILESGLRNAKLLQLLADRTRRDLVEKADVLVASSDSVFLACALANGVTLECCAKLLALAVSRTLETSNDDLAAPRFSRKYFEILCQEVFIGRPLSSLSKAVFIPGFRLSHPHLRCFHNLPQLPTISLSPAQDDTIASVVLRSLGSPSFFAPLEGYLDPSVFAPDPSSTLLSVFPPHALPLVRLLSLGSSRASPLVWENSANSAEWGILDWAPVQAQLAELCARQHSQTVVSALFGPNLHRMELLVDASAEIVSFAALDSSLSSAIQQIDPTSTCDWLDQYWEEILPNQ